MDNNIINTKNNNQSGVVKVSHEAASCYADLAKKWAIKTDDKVDGSEFSAKYYAAEARKQLNEITGVIASADSILGNVENVKTEISELAETSVNNMNTAKIEIENSIEAVKSEALDGVISAKTEAVSQIKQEKINAVEDIKQNSNVSIATTEQTGLVKPDGATITIAEDGTISSVSGASSGGGSWGNITGDIKEQIDLSEELKKYAKVDLSNTTSPIMSPVGYIVSSGYEDFDDAYRAKVRKSSGENMGLPYRQGHIYYSNGFIEIFGTDLIEYKQEYLQYNIITWRSGTLYKPVYTKPWMVNVQITPSLAWGDTIEGLDSQADLSRVNLIGAGDFQMYIANNTGRDVLINWRILGFSRKGAIKYGT